MKQVPGAARKATHYWVPFWHKLPILCKRQWKLWEKKKVKSKMQMIMAANEHALNIIKKLSSLKCRESTWFYIICLLVHVLKYHRHAGYNNKRSIFHLFSGIIIIINVKYHHGAHSLVSICAWRRKNCNENFAWVFWWLHKSISIYIAHFDIMFIIIISFSLSLHFSAESCLLDSLWVYVAFNLPNPKVRYTLYIIHACSM